MFWVVSRRVGPFRIGVGGRFGRPRGGRRSGPTQAELKQQQRDAFLDGTKSRFEDLVNQFVLKNGYLSLETDDELYRSIAPIVQDFNYLQRLVRDGGALTANRKETLLKYNYTLEDKVAQIADPKPLYDLSLKQGSSKGAAAVFLCVSIVSGLAAIFIGFFALVSGAALIAAICFFARAGTLGAEMAKLAEHYRLNRIANATLPAESRATTLAVPGQAASRAERVDEPLIESKTPTVASSVNSPDHAIANARIASPGTPIQELADPTRASPEQPDRRGEYDRLNWALQSVLLALGIILIGAGVTKSDEIKVGSVWGGVGWSLAVTTFVVFTAQLVGLRPLVRRVHAAILIPLFVVALVIVAATEPASPSSTGHALLGFMIFAFGIMALCRGAFVLIRMIRS